MKNLTFIALLLLLLSSCKNDPSTSGEVPRDAVFIQENQTYELILVGDPGKERVAMLTDCNGKTVTTLQASAWEHDGMARVATEYSEKYKVVFHCSDVTRDKYSVVPALLTVIDTLGQLNTVQSGVLIPGGKLNPGDIKEINIDGTVYRLVKAKATDAFQLEQGENKLYFVLVPRA